MLQSSSVASSLVLSCVSKPKPENLDVGSNHRHPPLPQTLAVDKPRAAEPTR